MGDELVLWRHGIRRHLGPRQVCVQYLVGEESGQAGVLSIVVLSEVVDQDALHKGPRIFNLALLVAYAVDDRSQGRVPPGGQTRLACYRGPKQSQS